MRKIITLYLIFFSLNCLASTPVWKVDYNNNSLFLAGTIHVLRASDYPLPKSFNDAYQQSSLIIFETDLNKMKSADSVNKMLRSVKLNDNKSFYDQLTPETIKRLERYSIENSINLSQFKQFKVPFVALSLLIAELQKQGVNQSGVDDYFNQQATIDAKETQGLETIDQQISFLSNMATGYEDEFMLQTLDDIKEIPLLFDSMISSWRNGDLKAIESLFITPTQKQFPNLNQQILVSRNHEWMPKIKQYLFTPEVEMIMVGSAHLAGEEGLIHLLKQSGYTITQLQ